MIQRLQSIWLILAAVAAFFSFRLAFYSGNFIGPDKIKNFKALTAGSSLVILVLTCLVTAIALLAIFLYKNRKLQLRLTLVTLIVSLLNLVIYYSEAQKFVAGEGSYSITALVTLIIPIFLFLAIKGINKDQKLVKSLDRLR